ncbi:hypothetical protein FQU96_31165 [Reyranella sp. CPCC 100927]|nr:hypothetical protein FQU96_31165 [Reyranella sp. CPCC 100927]
MVTILSEVEEHAVSAVDGLWLTAGDAERVTGWTLKPEGMCRDDACVPLPSDMTRDGQVDVAAFWQRLGNPVLHDDTRQTWMLGIGADARNDALADLQAPDFTLPDLDGAPHTLSALRGRKVFLTTWASW